MNLSPDGKTLSIQLLTIKDFPISVKVYTKERITPEKGENLAKELSRTLANLNDIFNDYESSSEISQLSQLKPGESREVSYELYQALRIAKALWVETNGLFDPTVKLLVQEWKKGEPSQERIEELKKEVGMNAVELSRGNKVTLKEKRSFDLGGLKGIFGDFLLANVREILGDNLETVIVDAGGDLRIETTKSARIGVAHPEKPSEFIASLELPSCGVATSGFYYRGHHIINPRTGRPVESDLLSATAIIYPSDKPLAGAWADGYATVLLALGKDKAREFALKHSIDALLIWKEKGKLILWLTPNLKDKYQINPKFKDEVEVIVAKPLESSSSEEVKTPEGKGEGERG